MGLGYKGDVWGIRRFLRRCMAGCAGRHSGRPYGGGWGRTNIFESTWRFGLCRGAAPLLGECNGGKGFGLVRWVRRSARQGSENGVAVATPFYLLYNIILLWCRP